MKIYQLKLISALICGCSLLALFSCNSKSNEEVKDTDTSSDVSLTEAQLQTIKLDTAKLENEETELSLTGEVSFDEDQVKKVYSLVGGNVIKVTVSLGDMVKKGQLLAVIKSSDISDIQSQYDVATNNLEVAKKNLDIANELYKTNVNSETQVLAVQNEYKRAQSELNKLKQTLSIYGAAEHSNDAQYNVYAPIDGYVVEKNINESMEVRSDNSANLFTVSSLNTIWVLADIYESDLSKVQVGADVDITTVAYPDKVFKGTIKRIGNVLDPQSKVVKARIELDNSDGLLKPEMFAVVKVHLKKSYKVTSVSANAVLFDKNNYYVMVKKQKGNFEKRQVQLASNTPVKAYIRSGLNQGEVVVSDGALFVLSNNF